MIKDSDVIFNHATKFMDTIRLPETLKQYGDPIITGSYALNTMVWNDIDLQLDPFDHLDSKEVLCQLCQYFIQQTPLIKLNVIDFYERQKPKMPKGLYVGCQIKDKTEDETWKVDIWILSKDDLNQNKQFIKRMKQMMTEDKRSLIMTLKVAMTEKYGRPPNMASYFVYQAVVDHGLTTKEEVCQFLRLKGISVDI